jgi:hypothetical protein
MIYFLKRCGYQELGSVGPDGKAKRGRYLMSSQYKTIVDFFPELSLQKANDTALLPIIPLYTGLKTYANYVYHNSKYTGSTAKHPRNEYRIYLNNKIEGTHQYFSPKDIIIMRKSEINSSVGDNKSDDFVYYLDVVKDHTSSLYQKLNAIIDAYPSPGGYALFAGELYPFEDKVSEFESGQKSNGIHIDPSVTERISRCSEEDQTSLFNSSTFRDFVLAGYGNACAVTGKLANSTIGEEVDVVYFIPPYLGGSHLPSNGIALSKNLSLLFVTGEFTLSDRLEIMVHPDSKNELLWKYDSKKIRIPPDHFFRPGTQSITYHREKIYGSFEDIG